MGTIAGTAIRLYNGSSSASESPVIVPKCTCQLLTRVWLHLTLGPQEAFASLLFYALLFYPLKRIASDVNLHTELKSLDF